jgi:M6 family metalloprotease-like protein
MRQVSAVLLALVFLSSAAWTFTHEEKVEGWLVGQIVVSNDESSVQVPLQDKEHWLVVVVDFEQNTANNGWGIDEADNMLNQAVVPYIEQLSGGEANLSITIHDTVIRANFPVEDYGQDATGKDSGPGGEFLPSALAEEAVTSIKDDVNWDTFDLNDDGTIDRFLVLHTTKGQEESPGTSNRIWSHFTHFEDPIVLTDDHTIEHYTMASLQTGTSGVGTIIHEMMHQMGAIDLYPVHDEVAFQSWKGPGDWDIMASGNWNGGGRWPAMPTGANMELVRQQRIEIIDLSWPPSTVQPCIGPTTVLKGVSEGGMVLKIPISDTESVFVEHRSDSGFDSRLPGAGILVSYQDLSVGDFERNEVNTNPNQPWLKVIEADGGDDLVRGSNQGEASDLFLNNTSFGAEGVKIRNHDGILVPWIATVSGEENLSVSFSAPSCNPLMQVDLSNHGSPVLPTGAISVGISGNTEPCTSDLISSDGRGVSLIHSEQGHTLEFSTQGTAPSTAFIEGTISCDGSTIQLRHPVHILNRIPQDSTFQAVVHPESTTMLDIPIASYGDGTQRFSVSIDGPLARVASGEISVLVAEETSYVLAVEPNGLLTENMLIYGTVMISTDDGMSWTIDVELEATATNDEWWTPLTEPGRIIGLMLAILGISALTSMNKKEKTPANEKDDTISELPTQEEQDPWGRPLDEVASTDAFNVQE